MVKVEGSNSHARIPGRSQVKGLRYQPISGSLYGSTAPCSPSSLRSQVLPLRGEPNSHTSCGSNQLDCFRSVLRTRVLTRSGNTAPPPWRALWHAGPRRVAVQTGPLLSGTDVSLGS